MNVYWNTYWRLTGSLGEDFIQKLRVIFRYYSCCREKWFLSDKVLTLIRLREDFRIKDSFVEKWNTTNVILLIQLAARLLFLKNFIYKSSSTRFNVPTKLSDVSSKWYAYLPLARWIFFAIFQIHPICLNSIPHSILTILTQLQSLVEVDVLKVADIFMRNGNKGVMQNLPQNNFFSQM